VGRFGLERAALVGATDSASSRARRINAGAEARRLPRRRRALVVAVTMAVVATLVPARPALAVCGATKVEDTSAYLSYVLQRQQVTDSAASGGTYSVPGGIGPIGANVSLTFTGSCVTLAYHSDTSGGVVGVAIDGTIVDSLDTSTCSDCGPPWFASRQYTTSAGTHTLLMSVAGPGPYNGYGFGLDYVMVDTPIAPVTCSGSTYEDNTTYVSYTGASWYSSGDSNASGQNYTYTAASGNAATFGFTGSCVSLVYLTSVGDGIANVFIDGTEVDTLDMYGPTAYRIKKTYTTASGSHWIKVVVTGTKRAAAAGTYVYVDAFIAAGYAPTAVTDPYSLGGYPNGAFAGSVNAATGNFFTSATDLVLPGRTVPFAFTRSYNAQDTVGGALGPGWLYFYEMSVIPGPANTVAVRRADGGRDVFTTIDGVHYTAPPGVFDTLVAFYNAYGVSQFQLTAKGQATYYFNGNLRWSDGTWSWLPASGRLTKIQDLEGNKVTIAYDGTGEPGNGTGRPYWLSENINCCSDPSTMQRQLLLAYDAAGHLTGMQEYAGSLARTWTYAYDSSGRLVTVTDAIGNTSGQTPSQHQWRYAYDGATARMTTLTDPDGRVRLQNTYDALGRVTEQRDGLNNATTFAYGIAQTVVTDPRANAATVAYDSRLRLLSAVDAAGTRTFTYDAAGNRTGATDRRGNRTDLTFDASGNPLTTTLPAVGGVRPVWQYSFDAKNNATTVTDPLGFTGTMAYDATYNTLTSETHALGGGTNVTSSYQYDPLNQGLPNRVTSPRGYATALTYSTKGDLASRTDPDGNKTTYAYDAAGRLTSWVDPDGNVTGGNPSQHTWTTAYDQNDRVTSTSDPLGETTTYTYDGAGDLLTATDPRGNLTTYTYDANARLVSVQQKPDPVGQPALVYTTTMTRDADGSVTRATEANGNYTDYAYDALNRLVSTTVHPASGVNHITALSLDPNGNVTMRTTADGVAVTSTYDALDRLTAVSGPSLAIAYGYDLASRRTSMTDATGTSTYSYDGLGRLTQAVQPNGTLSYGYDLDSNRTSIAYPGAASVAYTYGPADRLTQVSEGGRTSTYAYGPSGLVSTLSYPNGMTATYTYDRAQRLTSLVNAIGATTITSHAYTLDAAGNRTALDEFVAGITATGQTDHFGMSYDGLERLTAVTTTNAESFTLDGASNITARTGPTKTFTIDGADRPTSDGTNLLTWSSADRLTGRGSDNFGFDALDRMTSSTVASTGRTYAYNGDGLLQSRTASGSTVSLLWDPATSPSRLLVSGSDKIVYGLGPLYSVNGSTVTIYARDGQKSIRAELSGTSVTSSWRYRAYGDVVQYSGLATPTLLGYAGQLLDPSGPYYMRARWYDPTEARFLSRDPASSSTGAGALVTAFGYAAATPLNAADPSGLFATTDTSEGGACDLSCIHALSLLARPVPILDSIGQLMPHSVGVSGGFSAEAGLLDVRSAGVAASASVILATFDNGRVRRADGSILISGGVFETENGRTDGTPSGHAVALGGFAGAGGGFLVTNAPKSQQLSGPFDTVKIDLGFIGMAGLDVSWSNGPGGFIWTASPTIGGGAGFGFASMKTETWIKR
jgi:RHS repeat-associated protein